MQRSRFIRRVDRLVSPTDDTRWFTFVGDSLVLLNGEQTPRIPDEALSL